MAAPRFIVAGVGKTDAGDAWAYSSDVAASALGNLLILQILQDGTTSGAVTLSSGQNVEKLDGTANDWTSIGAFDVGSPTAAIQHLWIGRATSTSSAPYASGANSTSEDLYIRVYEFDRVSTGTTLATVIENVTAGATVNVVGTSATASDASVTTLGPDRLALNFVAVNDDNIIAQFSGQSGGAWSRVFTWYAESSGTDGAIQLQAAYLGIGVSDGSSGSSIFGAGGTSEQQAQSFNSGAGGSVTSVVLRTDKSGTPTDSLIVEIQTDAAGVPSGTVVGTAGEVPVADLVPVVAVSTWNVFPVTATLSASTTYWIVVRRSGSRDTLNYIRIMGNSSDVYSGGTPATMNSGTWTAGTNDLGFAIPLGSGSTIDGGTASITDSDAWGVVGFALIGTTSGTTTVPGSFTANAAIKKTIQSSFTANAVIFANSGTKTFAANAVIWNTDADYWDDFNRTVSSSMGTSPDTTDWANDSNWDVNGAAYRTFNNSGLFGTYPRFDHVDVENVRLRTLVSFSTNPTVGTDGHWFHLHVRDQNPTLNNVIAAAFRFRPGGNVDVRVDQRNNGDADWTWSVITNATIGTWSDLTTEKWWLEIDLTGANAELRAWKDGTSRPSSASRSGTLPSPFTGGGATGLRCGTSHTSDSVFSIWQWEVWELGGAITQNGSFTANAVLKKTIGSSFTANAVILKTQASSFTTNVIILASSGTKTFTANAAIWSTTATFWDHFSWRSSSGDLGTSADGNGWGTDDADWSVSEGYASSASVSSSLTSYNPGPLFPSGKPFKNGRVRALLNFSRNSVEGSTTPNLMLRNNGLLSTNNKAYRCLFQFRNTGGVWLLVQGRKNGGWTTISGGALAAYSQVDTWSNMTTEQWWCEFDVYAGTTNTTEFEARIWQEGESRPGTATATGYDNDADLDIEGTSGVFWGTANTTSTNIYIYSWEVWKFATTISGSFKADAALLKTQAGTCLANAVLRREQTASFTANAVRFKVQSGSTTADALKEQTQASSFIAAAVIQKTQAGSFAASAVRKATVSSSATADAVIGKGFAADVVASAVILKVTASTFAASAILFGARAGSTTANAVILRTASTFAAASRSPGVGVSFGRPSPNVAYVAQRFIQGVSGKYVIRFRVWKNGSPTDNIKVDVANDTNGTPSTPVHIYTSISGTEMGTSDPGTDTLVVSSESLSAGTYWIVWYRSGGTNAANFYYLNDGLDDYGSGDRASFIVGGSWDVATGEDLYFQFSSGPTLDSVIKSTSTGSFVVAAAILRQAQANRTVDAVLQRPQTGSFGASAVLRREGVGSLVASAVVLRGTSSQFLVAATFLVHREQSYVLDATKLRTTEGTFSLSAVLKREAVGSFAVNAVALATGLGSTHLDALLLRAATGATTVDATIIAAVGGSLSAAALLNSVSRCVWVSPADGVQMSDTPVLVFLMPVAAAGNMHFSIEIDEDAGFGSPLTYTSHGDLTGWEYWDDAAWQPIPQDGVPNTYCGNEARYTVQTPLANGTWHRRVRAGVI